MACPSGCLNGGGQIKPKDKTPAAAKELIKQLDSLYHQQRTVSTFNNPSPLVVALYAEWLGGQPYSAEAKKWLHTQYHAREKIVNALAIKW